MVQVKLYLGERLVLVEGDWQWKCCWSIWRMVKLVSIESCSFRAYSMDIVIV